MFIYTVLTKVIHFQLIYNLLKATLSSKALPAPLIQFPWCFFVGALSWCIFRVVKNSQLPAKIAMYFHDLNQVLRWVFTWLAQFILEMDHLSGANLGKELSDNLSMYKYGQTDGSAIYNSSGQMIRLFGRIYKQTNYQTNTIFCPSSFQTGDPSLV